MSKITIVDVAAGTQETRNMTTSEQNQFDADNAATAGDKDPRKAIKDAEDKKAADKAAGIEKLKGLGLSADEAAAVSSR